MTKPGACRTPVARGARGGSTRRSSGPSPASSATYYYTSVGDRSYEIVTPPGGATVTKIQNYPASSNRLSTVTTNGTVTRSFTHDAAGNIVGDVKGGDTYTTTYNVRNRPVSVARTGTASQTSSYGYNGLEQMVTRSTTAPGGPAGTLHYIYDTDGHLIAEADGATGATLREYIWLASNDNDPVDLPLALVTGVNTASPVLSMVHADHLGRPIRMTNAARALGADIIIDYKSETYSDVGQSWDVIADTVAVSSFRRCLPILSEGGRYLSIAGGLADMLVGKRGAKRSISGPAKSRQEDLLELRRLAETGAYTPLIDSVYAFEEMREAHIRTDTGRKRGSVVVRIASRCG